jgi:hypothetical protein
MGGDELYRFVDWKPFKWRVTVCKKEKKSQWEFASYVFAIYSIAGLLECLRIITLVLFRSSGKKVLKLIYYNIVIFTI